MHSSGPVRGVSLIEALVAIAVMAFGMLGLAGLQASLRNNADQARQRSEAVRLAQASIENQRSFSVLDATVGRRAYDQIVTAAAADVTPAGSNTQFSRQVTVTDFPAPADLLSVAPHKHVVTTVTWADRANLPQTVRLASIVSGTPPEAAAAISATADASPVQQAGGRNQVIPVGAIDQGDGTSKFAPPGGGALRWVFNNSTGFITQICAGAVCVDVNARLLSGYVNFATGVAAAPTGSEAETPPSPSLVNGIGESVTVSVSLTSPVVGSLACYQAAEASYVAYYCAIPLIAPVPSWSGRALVNLPAGLDLAGSVNDDDDDEYRVCRYTTAAARVLPHLVVPAIRNEDHPLDYAGVRTSLNNQNFLVIRAGDDNVPFACPADDAATIYINGSTWHHQPSS